MIERKVRGDGEMQKPQFTWNINVGTIVTLALAAVAGIYKISTLEGQINQLDQRGASRIIISDKNFADQAAFNKTMADVPYRVGALEGNQSAMSDRIDRLADAVLASQEAIRKDISALSAKIEVLVNKVDTANAMPKRTVFSPSP